MPGLSPCNSTKHLAKCCLGASTLELKARERATQDGGQRSTWTCNKNGWKRREEAKTGGRMDKEGGGGGGQRGEVAGGGNLINDRSFGFSPTAFPSTELPSGTWQTSSSILRRSPP